MTPINQLPSFDWNDQAKEEILREGQDLINRSHFSWAVGDVVICGLIYSTYTSPPWFWFAMSKGVTLRDLIDFRRLARLIPRGTMTAVAETFREGIRFAEFYGFTETDHTVDGYKIYRRL